MSQKMESVGWIAAGVAHEFANLLGTIQGEIGITLSEMSPRARGRKNLERIEAALTPATGIVKLLMTSAAAGGVSTEYETVDLSFIVDQMLGLLRGSISKRVVVRTALSRQRTAVRGNLVEIQLVVMNLITNAIEALGKKKGVVTVSKKRVRIGAGLGVMTWANVDDGDYVRLNVEGAGPGMDAETRARIFDEKRRDEGLGLSVVHRIIRFYRGAINVASTSGDRSTFEVLLPSVSSGEANDVSGNVAGRSFSETLAAENVREMRLLLPARKRDTLPAVCAACSDDVPARRDTAVRQRDSVARA